MTDAIMGRAVAPATESGHPPLRHRGESILDQPSERLTTVGNYPGHVAGVSLYTKAAMHPLLAGAAVIGAGLGLAALARKAPHRPVRITGSVNETTAKALHIRLEAKRGQESEVERLLQNILACVDREPGTGPWYGVRYTHSTFGIFETFPDEAARDAHLTGEGARILMNRSNTVLAAPARIDKLDVLLSKEFFADQGRSRLLVSPSADMRASSTI